MDIKNWQKTTILEYNINRYSIYYIITYLYASNILLYENGKRTLLTKFISNVYNYFLACWKSYSDVSIEVKLLKYLITLETESLTTYNIYKIYKFNTFSYRNQT